MKQFVFLQHINTTTLPKYMKSIHKTLLPLFLSFIPALSWAITNTKDGTVADTANLPKIIKAEIKRMFFAENKQEFYNIDLEVKTKRADWIKVELEEANSPYITLYTKQQPDTICMFTINSISIYDWALLTITVGNGHGEVVSTIEVPVHPTGISETETNENITIEVYDAGGKMLGCVKSTEDLKKFKKRILIVKVFTNSRLKETKKIQKQFN